MPPLLGRAAATALRPLPNSTKQRINPWRRLRGKLTRWAEEQRSGAYWCLLPGDQLLPTTAAVVTILDPSPSMVHGTVKRLLARVGTQGRLAATDLRELRQLSTRESALVALEELREQQGEHAVLPEPERLPEQLGFKPAQTTLFRLLLDDDLLLKSQPVLRIAARVIGSNSDQVNTLTDGRVDLARLVGGGPDAPLRMAALRLVGQLHCTQAEPLCAECPLSRMCAYAQKNQKKQVLF